MQVIFGLYNEYYYHFSRFFKYSLLVLTYSLLFSCSQTKSSLKTNVPSNLSTKHSKMPVVAVNIRLEKDVFAVTEINDMGILISLTNNTSATQEVLFDMPESSTGGPWATSVKLVNSKTKKSVLETESYNIQEKEYSYEQLKRKYTQVLPGETIEKKYRLTDLIVFKSTYYPLNHGTYNLRIFYYDNPSNVITFIINRLYPLNM